jgi:two-component sensor histidine kinase/tetratricopeptide (TPR) repeat protein
MRLRAGYLLRSGARLLGLILLIQSSQGAAGDDSSRYLPRYRPATDARAFFDSARATGQTDPRLSLRYARRGLEIARAINDPRLLAAGHQLSGEAYFQFGANDSAEACHRRAVGLAQTAGDDSLKAAALSSAGLMAYIRRNLALSMELCNQALGVARQANMRRLAVRINNTLGLTSQYFGQPTDDIAYFRSAMEEAIAIADTEGIALTHNHLGNWYSDRGMLDSAMLHFQRALFLRQKIESGTNAIAIIHNNIGNTLRLEHDDQRAFDSYQRSLAISTRTGSRNLIATTNKNMALLARQMNDSQAALAYARKAKALSMEIGLPRVAVVSSEQLARALAAQGEYHQAYDSLLAYIALKDSIDGQDGRRRVAELQIRFESEHKERRIQELALDKEKTIRDFLIAVIGLTLLLGAVLVWLFREKSKAARATAIQNEALEGLYDELVTRNTRLEESQAGLRSSLREKDVLLKEVHHRVKNNLQVVSSLLSLQSNTVNNEQTIELLRESQDRIRAMALVHERLYRSNDFAGIDVNGYLSDLVENLRTSYRTERLEVTVESDPVFVSLDSAIPLGLIVSELVTNAFKHGFPDRGSGAVRVSVRSTGKDECTLVVQDNGTGMPPGFAVENTSSLGLHLVQILVEQIEGRLVATNSNGAHFAITFPITPKG